jgi:CheY-like chemotaxis protein
MTGANQTGEAFSNSLSSQMVAEAGADNVAKISAEKADASNSLWQAAYENPGTTALVVGGTALAVGAAIASRGKLVKLLPTAKNDVLLVEDSAMFGNAFKETLESQGNRVTWVTGAEDLKALKAGIATGPSGQPVPVHLERYRAAFVDGDLAGKVTGAQVVERLTAQHVASVGISSQPTMNAAMLKEGAIAADLKPSVFGALVNKEISVGGILKDPTAVQGKLDSFRTRFMADSTVGAKASEILKKAMERFGV